MPRPRIQSNLPLLKGAAIDFTPHSSKASQIAARLREIISEHPNTKSTIFYPLREIAEGFRVSLRTANLALKILEREDLLVPVRGSHSRIPGKREWGPHPTRATVGLPLWMFGIRYSQIHRYFPLELSHRLWEQNLTLTTIPFSEIGDRLANFESRLTKLRMDFAIWLYPFPHNRNTLLHLNDRGVGNLIIQHSGDPKVQPPDLLVQHERAYAQVLRCWKNLHRIHRILIPIGTEYPRGRGTDFARAAGEFGLACEEVPCTPELAASLTRSAKSRSKRLGIALLDEHATAEFSHFDPPAFQRVLKRHRVLFGNNLVNLPFVPELRYTAERIFVHPEQLAEQVSRQFTRRLAGNPEPTAIEVKARVDLAWPLHRYV